MINMVKSGGEVCSCRLHSLTNLGISIAVFMLRIVT